ncbi:uncharacterized protein PRCAT00003265001 [Priceomyces carsonii]|uniref:uncharacterized protein n=1 Tax=Priceomyces carsonii TaxID=28549 RepID=UPI002EDB6A67|nr:unnamed protein product [Priceomyces carsonii]
MTSDKSDTTINDGDCIVKDENKLSSKKKKKSSKKAKDPSTLTPEYIEEQRRLRNIKKEEKRKDRIAKGLDPSQTNDATDLSFIKRDFVPVEDIKNSNDFFKIKIMTYNVLAQTLIRRSLFPTNGDALKWVTRSKVLLSEIRYYDPTIICLQELDVVHYKSFWKKEFEDLGYETKFFNASSKTHGVAIVFKTEFFTCLNQSFINYDKEKTGDITPTADTQNIGLLVHLKLNSGIIEKFPNIKRNGIIIGTSHLFWHPLGTFERTRQTYIVLKKFKEFQETLLILSGNENRFYSFFAGDFNSQPFDPPYLSIVSKPVVYDDRARALLSPETTEEEVASICKNDGDHNNKSITSLKTEPLKLIENIKMLHNSLDMRAISLYSIAYRHVHPENSGRDNDRNEPMFSNWAHAWRGLLDYIFIIAPWSRDTDDIAHKIDSLDDISKKQNVKLFSLLKLPAPEDMGDEPSGQPRIGQFPSDHLCLMVEIGLC